MAKTKAASQDSLTNATTRATELATAATDVDTTQAQSRISCTTSRCRRSSFTASRADATDQAEGSVCASRQRQASASATCK